MNIFEQHEIFEIEVLEKLKTGHFLRPLIFGGGTMLRLCFELNRYSVDLDFWFFKNSDFESYYTKLHQYLGEKYDLTDAENIYHTLLFEIRDRNYPRRLKIEIRKEVKTYDFQESIAFSPFSNKQILLRTLTMEQAMCNKISALLDRNEIRDAFDIEFLLRKGISLPDLTEIEKTTLIKKLDGFKPHDFKVKLGSVLNPEMREYYTTHRFNYLQGKLV